MATRATRAGLANGNGCGRGTTPSARFLNCDYGRIDWMKRGVFYAHGAQRHKSRTG